MKKLYSKVYIAASTIHGQGLFAGEKISKDTILGILEGKPTHQDGSYVLWIDEENGFEVSGDLKYINHSESPNACYFDDLSVMAIKDIAADEEITHNYGTDWLQE